MFFRMLQNYFFVLFLVLSKKLHFRKINPEYFLKTHQKRHPTSIIIDIIKWKIK